MRRLVLGAGIPMLSLFAVALVVRLGQHHAALLYPDGYQYLLMARGLGENLQPTTTLGPSGDTFVPSPDAAAKPLFPLLVAGVHLLGVSWLDAARLVTAVASALAVLALALLVTRLSGSALAGAGAGLLLLASPSIGFWSGFSGPDPLAQALALTAALALVHRRPITGGVLAGLATAARPELGLVVAAAAIVSLRSGAARRDLARAVPAAAISASSVFVGLRTPITLPDGRLVWLALLVLGLVVLAAVVPPTVLRYTTIVGGAAVALALLTQPGPAELWRNDWPLLALGAVGFVLLVRDEGRASVASVVIGLLVLVGAVYLFKNPTLERYFSLLLPAAAVLAGVSVASLSRRSRPVLLGAMASACVLGLLSPVPGSRDYDMFSIVAERVAPRLESNVLVTAAPDAYGFWLPEHTVREMRRGARGAVLLDAAQRLYAPELGAEGDLLTRVTGEIAFSLPDGEIDADPAVLIAGRVVSRSQGRPRSQR